MNNIRASFVMSNDNDPDIFKGLVRWNGDNSICISIFRHHVVSYMTSSYKIIGYNETELKWKPSENDLHLLVWHDENITTSEPWNEIKNLTTPSDEPTNIPLPKFEYGSPVTYEGDLKVWFVCGITMAVEEKIYSAPKRDPVYWYDIISRDKPYKKKQIAERHLQYVITSAQYDLNKKLGVKTIWEDLKK